MRLIRCRVGFGRPVYMCNVYVYTCTCILCTWVGVLGVGRGSRVVRTGMMCGGPGRMGVGIWLGLGGDEAPVMAMRDPVAMMCARCFHAPRSPAALAVHQCSRYHRWWPHRWSPHRSQWQLSHLPRPGLPGVLNRYIYQTLRCTGCIRGGGWRPSRGDAGAGQKHIYYN